MTFSSVSFLCLFLPAVFGLYHILPGARAKNALLIAASLLFYAWGEPVYILLMILSVLVNWLAGRWIGSARKGARLPMVLAVVFNLALLGVFKYSGFLMETLGAVTGLALPVPRISLPIGISFFTFQAMSYLIDLYRGDVPVQKSLVAFGTYVSLFPQLIAGPIVRMSTVSAELSCRRETADLFSSGIRRFVAGLGKKVLLANNIGAVWTAISQQDVTTLPVLTAWIGLAAFTLQIYFDFSGYSDMAIGLGKMFGFTFIENFRLPYTATSIQDFWRKWHISLSSWFKEYVYIPLGGNRRGTARTYVNLWTVFLLTGIWHGAGWTFIFWGIYHGFFNVLERCFLGKWLKQEKFRPLAHIYAVFVVLIGWIFFRADTIGQAFSFIRYMFVPHSAVVLMERYMNRKLWMFLAAARAGAGWIGDGHKLDRLHGDPVVFHFAACQQYI